MPACCFAQSSQHTGPRPITPGAIGKMTQAPACMWRHARPTCFDNPAAGLPAESPSSHGACRGMTSHVMPWQTLAGTQALAGAQCRQNPPCRLVGTSATAGLSAQGLYQTCHTHRLSPGAYSSRQLQLSLTHRYPSHAPSLTPPPTHPMPISLLCSQAAAGSHVPPRNHRPWGTSCSHCNSGCAALQAACRQRHALSPAPPPHPW
jgi:hypothetical protein